MQSDPEEARMELRRIFYESMNFLDILYGYYKVCPRPRMWHKLGQSGFWFENHTGNNFKRLKDLTLKGKASIRPLRGGGANGAAAHLLRVHELPRILYGYYKVCRYPRTWHT